MAIKAAGAGKGRVEDFGKVGGCDHDDARVLLEAVHLGKDLVEGFSGVVLPAAAVGTDSVDLVYEDNAWCSCLGRLHTTRLCNTAMILTCCQLGERSV